MVVWPKLLQIQVWGIWRRKGIRSPKICEYMQNTWKLSSCFLTIIKWWVRKKTEPIVRQFVVVNQGVSQSSPFWKRRFCLFVTCALIKSSSVLCQKRPLMSKFANQRKPKMVFFHYRRENTTILLWKVYFPEFELINITISSTKWRLSMKN